MRKPKVPLRKPSRQPVDPATAEAFTALDEAPAGTPLPPTSALTSMGSPKETEDTPLPHEYRWRRTVRTKVDGSASKRLTLYLPEPLARRLAILAEEERRPMSAIVTEALEAVLDKSE